MNHRVLKNGKKIEEPDFQKMLADLRLREPEATEEDLLKKLNKAKPGNPDVELKAVPKKKTKTKKVKK